MIFLTKNHSLQKTLYMSKKKVDFIKYKDASPCLRKHFAKILNITWPGSFSNNYTSHNLNLSPISFFVCVEGCVVSYCVVLFKEIFHAGNSYRMAGLNCVCTQLEYRMQGYGSQIVKTATEFITNSDIDIGLFTCDTELSSFYVKHGWTIAKNVYVISGLYPGRASSKDFNKVVLLHFFSEKSQKDRDYFHNTVINLNLPLGECW